MIAAPSSVTVQKGVASAVASVNLSSDSAVEAFLAGMATPITGVSLSDVNGVGPNGNFTATLADTYGLLSANSGAPGGGGTITGAGTKALTIAGTLGEVNADLSTLTDLDSQLLPDSITVNANDGIGGTAAAETILVGHTFTLTTAAATVTGGPGNDLVAAASGTLVAGDQINGNGGTDTLALVGAGAFNLAVPATLANIAIIAAQEGQAAYSGGGKTYTARNQIIELRAGLNAIVNVSPDTAINAGNPDIPTITIIGANNSDIVNLASGNDIVTVGSAAETVNLGSGNDTISVTSATIGATIGNGTGLNTLDVSGGGTMTMGSNINSISTVALAAAASAYNFTANAQGGLTLNDKSTGADILTAGGAGQTLTGGAAGKVTMIGAAAGGDTFKDTAALLNGDTIAGFAAANDAIDFTNVQDVSGVIKSFVENNAGTAGTLTVSDGTHSASVTLFGQFAANGFQAAADSSGLGTIITYQPHTVLTSPPA